MPAVAIVTTEELFERYAELPVAHRVGAAADAIYRAPTMTIEQRCELLAMALWPVPDSASGEPHAGPASPTRGA